MCWCISGWEEFVTNRIQSWGRRVAVWIATGFGLGFSPFAPGTVGTLLGIVIVYFTNSELRVPGQIIVAALLAVAAIPVCDIAEKRFARKDPHCVVADEYLTFPICMIGLPLRPWLLVFAFLSNRALDIVKPPPARQLQILPGGWGIVVDDVISSLYSLAVNHLVYWVVVRFF